MKVAVLVDVISIQDYIFSSNKLKENLGASYIVENLFSSILKKGEDDKERGYIGGGKALMIFDTMDEAKERIEEFSLDTLVNYPGIKLAVAFNEGFDLESEEVFVKQRVELFNKLERESKNRVIPITVLPSYGINAECPYTAYSAEVKNKDDGKCVSSVSDAKFIVNKQTKEKWEGLLGDNKDMFTFTENLEKLGQVKGEDSHIAIVHIDGNSMGERFKKRKTIDDSIGLSEDVEKNVKESFYRLIELIGEELNSIKSFINLEENEGKVILPIRPIVLSGDDITFVTEGRMGIYFAVKYMEYLEEKVLCDGTKMTSCAGISIVKTKYPFYRGYKMAEELCRNAKKVMRENNQEESWFDFHISYGGLGNSLEDIRKGFYLKERSPRLSIRPFRLSEFDDIVANISQMKVLPQSLIKDLRLVLTLSTDERKNFFEKLDFRKELDLLPKRFRNNDYLSSNKEECFFYENKTPYLDFIELMDLLPDYLFNKE